jgi:AraC family transcriptional regulator
MSCFTQQRKNKAFSEQAVAATRDLLNRVVPAAGWQQQAMRCGELQSQIAVSICTHNADRPAEYAQIMPRDAYTVAILLDDAHICLDADAQRVIDASLEAGTCYVSHPGETLRLICMQGYKALHLRIPSQLLWFSADAQRPCAALLGQSLGPVKDPLLLGLARTLADVAGNDKDGSFAQQIVGMLIERIRGLRVENASMTRVCRRTTLPNWRLLRVDSYVKSRLSESITLSDMANSAGLSPMHFAAQFRAATGYRPHQYLLLCRLERAKELMANASCSMLDIALDVGFHTQSHFTNVFKRLTGKTPGAWRDDVLLARLAKVA